MLYVALLRSCIVPGRDSSENWDPPSWRFPVTKMSAFLVTHCDQKCNEIENSWYSCEDSRHSLRKENWKNKFFSMMIVTMENYDQATSILFLLLTAACCLFVLFQVRYWLLRVLFSPQPQSYLLRGMKYSFLNNWNNWSLSTKVITIFHYSFLIFATYVYFHTHLLFAKLTINFIFDSGSKGPGQHSVSFVCGT